MWKKKRLIAAMLVIAIVMVAMLKGPLSDLPAVMNIVKTEDADIVPAGAPVNSNEGTTCTYQITADGTLKIGNGKIVLTKPYSYSEATKDFDWLNHREDIKKIETDSGFVVPQKCSYMFCGCSGLKDLTPIKGWNTGNVTDMSRMFGGCSGLTSLTGLENWNTGNVTDMEFMFWGCSGLTSLTGLRDWNTGNVTNMEFMFYGCSGLTDLTPITGK